MTNEQNSFNLDERPRDRGASPSSSDEYLSPRSVRGGRYLLMAVLFILAFALIFFRTSSLQFSRRELNPVALTRGQGAVMTVQAPRGDIVDRAGRPIAFSEFSDSLYFAYTGLKQKQLNHCLLELALLLESQHVEPLSNLSLYFDMAESDKENPIGEEKRFVFKKQLDEIKRWQQNPDLFNLAPEGSKDGTRLKVMLDPASFYQYLLFEAFEIEDAAASGSLRYSLDEAWKIMKLRYALLEHHWTFAQGEPVKLASHLPDKVKAMVLEQNQRYQGALIRRESVRRYSEDSRFFAHALGYVGAISANEYEAYKSFGYHMNDTVGKAGVEYSAERYLHGENGSAPYGVWFNNKEGESFVEGEGGKAAVAGATVRISLDLPMQKILRASLIDTLRYVRDKELGSGRSAAAVMLDLKTGAILAMDSLPSFDPLDFIRASYDAEAAARVSSDLNDGKLKPMLNRCISEIYAPGSTFKPISAAAAIMQGVISPSASRYECKGQEEIGYKEWVCYEEPIVGHGSINLTEAMFHSCNLYFFKMAMDTGIEALSNWAAKLGLGEYSGIDLPGEAKGIRPDPELKAKTRSKAEDQEWYPADTCQTSIGQFDNAYTMLQMTRAIGALANNQLLTPHLIFDIRDANDMLLRAEQIEAQEVGLSLDCVKMIRESMRSLKYYEKAGHTFRNFSQYPVDVSAKTGTAEVGFDADSVNALFVTFAPTDDPEIAIACIVEQGGKGDVASNIARDLMDAYFGFEARDEIKAILKELEAKPPDLFEQFRGEVKSDTPETTDSAP